MNKKKKKKKKKYSREPSDSTTKAWKRFVVCSCFHVVYIFDKRVSSFPTNHSIYSETETLSLQLHGLNLIRRKCLIFHILLVTQLTFQCGIITSEWSHEIGMLIGDEFHQLVSIFSGYKFSICNGKKKYMQYVTLLSRNFSVEFTQTTSKFGSIFLLKLTKKHIY